jgi:hypothetical protein
MKTFETFVQKINRALFQILGVLLCLSLIYSGKANIDRSCSNCKQKNIEMHSCWLKRLNFLSLN